MVTGLIVSPGARTIFSSVMGPSLFVAIPVTISLNMVFTMLLRFSFM